MSTGLKILLVAVAMLAMGAFLSGAYGAGWMGSDHHNMGRGGIGYSDIDCDDDEACGMDDSSCTMSARIPLKAPAACH